MAGELTGITAAVEAILPGRSTARRIVVPDSARVPVMAALAAQHSAAVLALVPTPARAGALAEEVALFAQRPVLRLPEREGLPYELARDDGSGRVERARALAALSAGNHVIVVASWASISEHCAPPVADAAAIRLSTGPATPPPDLVFQLEGMGYEVDHLADRPGTVARRGGIVDVFPPGADQPARIEYFGDEIESIRLVDLATQRSTGRISDITLGPGPASTGHARMEASRLAGALVSMGEASEAVIEAFALVGEGGRSPFPGFMESLVHATSALDHVPSSALVLVEDLDLGEEALSRLCEHDARARDELVRRGSLPSGLGNLRVPPAELTAWLDARTGAIELQRFGAEEPGATRLPIRTAASFAGKLKTVVDQAIAWSREGRPVVVASQQALRLAELLDADGAAPRIVRALREPPEAGRVTLVATALSGGFGIPGGLVVVSDAEIFGFRKRRRPVRTRAGVRHDLVSTLELGDYLVHADHGIARYGGLIRRSTEGLEREYLELQYAEGDRIYVPADQLDSVTRYVGPSDAAPSLTRLGSGEWRRATRRVRQAVLEMAAELLQLYARRELARGHAFSADTSWQMEMEAAFPFVETPEQLQAIAEVKADMERERPMDRLICGDVGYGKTEVAVRAAFKAVADGKQVAVLVPTTVLAEQHGATFRERTAGFPLRVEVLSRFRSEQEQRAIVNAVADGGVDICIGTHRLLGRDVRFKDLGLVVIDEEQRFGVSHKERLRQMREEVDTLVLSATPIPRTLQMSLSGIRDMSTIMSPPEERLPIRTYVLGWDDELLREAIARELQRGGQVYFVHNRVHNIERIVTRLRRIVPEAAIAVGHGQMPEEQLERVMMEFAAGDHDILVCTTIIESGLDIPNVNTIVINNADQFGLAQLYQLRGRVGRGANQAYAYLMYDKDRTMTETGQKRLEAIFEATELGAGFQIALRDLEIRGAGNVLGAEQSGHIAAVGFEMYSKLMADAVAALKATVPGHAAGPAPLPPSPVVDLPISAHIPESYILDIHDRLNVYQRIALIEDATGVATMQEELRDRFGLVPPSVESLLYISLVKAVGRRAGIESIKSDEQMFHLRTRLGLSDEARARVQGLALPGVLPGPRAIRVDRVAHARDWQAVLVRILRAMAE